MPGGPSRPNGSNRPAAPRGSSQARDNDAGREVRDAFAGLYQAFKQVATVGTPEQVERGLAIVNDARKQLYQILAAD